MKVVNYVKIDFCKNQEIIVPSMQYDSGCRWIRLKLYNNGTPMNLSGIQVRIIAVKPDGKEVFKDCVIIDAQNGVAEFEITNQIVLVAGEVECQVKLMKQDKLLSSDIFTLFVNRGLMPKNLESKNQLNVLVDALNRVENLEQKLSDDFSASFIQSQTDFNESYFLKQLSTTWEIDYRVSELEWLLEDHLSSAVKINETVNMKTSCPIALSRFEQAKSMILGESYNRATLERQLKRYYEKDHLTKDEYETLIALMDGKELVTEN